MTPRVLKTGTCTHMEPASAPPHPRARALPSPQERPPEPRPRAGAERPGPAFAWHTRRHGRPRPTRSRRGSSGTTAHYRGSSQHPGDLPGPRLRNRDVTTWQAFWAKGPFRSQQLSLVTIMTMKEQRGESLNGHQLSPPRTTCPAAQPGGVTPCAAVVQALGHGGDQVGQSPSSLNRRTEDPAGRTGQGGCGNARGHGT